MKWRFKMEDEKFLSGWAVPQRNSLTMADVKRIMRIDQERLERLIQKLREKQIAQRVRLRNMQMGGKTRDKARPYWDYFRFKGREVRL